MIALRVRTTGHWVVTALLLPWLVACGSDNNSNDNNGIENDGTDSDVPDAPIFDSADFGVYSATVDNSLFPLIPGQSQTLEGLNDQGQLETVIATVSHQTREVAGIDSAIVIDRAYINGELVEETFDWYAQDLDGNVWYMGEASNDYEDGTLVSTLGSWETNLDVDGVGALAQPGYIMLAEPTVGTRYKQEDYPGVADDFAEIVSLNANVTLADGSQYEALKVAESVPLESSTPLEHKYYVEGLGLILAEDIDGEERIELTETTDQRMPDIVIAEFSHSLNIDHPLMPLPVGASWRYLADTDEGQEEIIVEVLDATRLVAGVTTRSVRDRVFLDGLLIEDTTDWFAQDNDGNVWYFGEIVRNIEYDETGNIVSEDDDGSWEAGVDGAQPGINLPAAPRVGDTYRQEYWLGEAEDIAEIVSLDASVTLADGSQYSTLQTRDWNPLEPDSDEEFKFYALGVGLIKEQDVGGETMVELVEFTLQ